MCQFSLFGQAYERPDIGGLRKDGGVEHSLGYEGPLFLPDGHPRISHRSAECLTGRGTESISGFDLVQRIGRVYIPYEGCRRRFFEKIMR